MNELKYKALALDLDGTLTDSNKQIPQENKEAIWKAIDKGVIIILASGRPTMGITGIAKELELDKRGGVIVAFNGGKIFDCKTGEMISGQEFPHELIPDVCATAAKHGVVPLSYNDTQIICENEDDEYVLKECKCNYTTVLKVDNLPAALDFPITKLLVVGVHEKLLGVQAELLERHSDQIESFFSESYFLEVAPKGIRKDAALATVCEHLGITKEELMVCGDGLNDISMFDFAGFAVGMKNSYPEAAAHADVIVPKTNDECGVAYAIEKYILGE